ncbi:hypothetical protein Sjap_017200 [Stephania japonica]|uniref:Diacylglycerol O-acyltransferase n=1 Tax=Stephania japonica TaxID=461633 RepID=A0AAP0I5T6_9MAGN
MAVTEEISSPPLSPMSAAFASSSISILPVFKFEVPINEHSVIELLRNELVPFNDRLSSVLHTDKKSVQRWRKVDFNVKDLVVAPTFPSGLSPEEYDQHLHEYLSKIGTEVFPKDRPLWEVHIIKYPTTIGGGAVVFKLSHAIGDGYSLISLLMKGFQRADDPSLPLTFPNVSLRPKAVRTNGCGFTLKCFNTISDVGVMMLRGRCLKDHKTAVRSGKPQLHLEPIVVSTINLPLEDIRQVKAKVQGSVNDVITGVIHYAIHLYMFKKKEDLGGDRMTSMAMLNMRSLRSFDNINEMMKAGIWGNGSISLPTPIPTFVPEKHIDRDPLEFVVRAKKSMKRIRDSVLVQFTFPITKLLKRMKGAEGVAEFIYSTLNNTTTLITNVIGPNDKMAMAGYPISDFFYILTGVPQSIVFTVISYIGSLKVAVTMEKGFIDSQLFTLCMKEAFQKILQEACDKDCKGVRNPS